MFTKKDYYEIKETGIDSEYLCGYQQKTYDWDDFTASEWLGEKCIKDMYYAIKKECENDYVLLTELALILNWKLWQHYENGNMHISKVYNDLWEKHCAWCQKNFKGDALSYYYTTTD